MFSCSRTKKAIIKLQLALIKFGVILLDLLDKLNKLRKSTKST